MDPALASDPPTAGTQRGVLVGLVLVCALSIGLRWTGIGHLLPHKNEPDGQIVHLSQDHPGGPFRGKYPFLPIVLNDAVAGGPVEDLEPALDLDEHLENASLPFLRARNFLTLLAWLLIPGTFLLAKRFFTRGWAVFAAGLMGVCPLLLCYSVQARPHALVAAAGVGAMLAALRLTRSGGWGAQMLAALATGACVSCMHTGLAALAPFSVAAWIAARRFGRASFYRSLVGLVLIGAMGTWAYWPAEADALREGGRQADVMEELGMGEDWRGAGVRGSMRLRDPNSRVESGAESESAADMPSIQIGSHRIYLNYFKGEGFLSLVRCLRSYDPILFVLSSIGALLLLSRVRGLRSGRIPLAAQTKRDLLVVAAHGLPTLLVLGMYVGSKERFFLPLLPHFALLATGAAALVAAKLSGLIGKLPAVAVVTLLALTFPLVTSSRLALVRTRPDTYSQAADWLAEHVRPRGATVSLANMTDIPVRQGNLYGVWARRAAVSWRNYQRRFWPPGTPVPAYKLHYPNKKNMFAVITAEDPAAEYAKLLEGWNPDYAMVAPYGVSVEGYVDADLPRIAREAILARGGELVARISPFGDEDLEDMGLEYYFGVDAKRRLWELERLGPLIEVYSLR